jgi:hypothetical protein
LNSHRQKYPGYLSNPFHNIYQQDTPGLLAGAFMEMNKSVALPQPVKSDASPRSQRVPTELVILDLEPKERKQN